MKARFIKLEYKEGFYQSSKGNKKRNLQWDKSEYTWTNGNGFYKLQSFSKYLLTFKINDTIHTIDIRYKFGEYGIRLIKRRRNIIENNIPEYFDIDVNNDGSFTINHNWFNKWIQPLNLN